MILQRLSVVFLLVPLCLSAQTSSESGEPLTIRRTENFDITGRGTAAAWKSTEWITLEKRKGTADYRTRVKLLYSETGIYTIFSCEDNKITATLDEDFAKLWTEDVVEIFFWTDESEPLYFEYELSPLNYELPILVPNMNGDFLGWRPWQYEGERRTRHATHVMRDQNGNVREWIAEFFIPYALLKPLKKVPPQKGTVWRVNMYRIDHDDQNTSWSWKPVQKSFHDYQKFGVMKFE